MKHGVVRMVQLLSLTLVALTMAACGDSGTGPASKVDSRGLTPAIRALVPDSLLRIMDSLGMPIYGGATPPSVLGTFDISPYILLASNRPGDAIGSVFEPYYVAFSNQNNDNLTLQTDYVNGPEVGTGLGSFIVGQDSEFSVFTPLTTVTAGDTANLLALVSGVLRNDGIHNTYVAEFMIDNHGNLSGYYIDNGQGRVFDDQDGVSGRIGSLPAPTMNRSPAPKSLHDLSHSVFGGLFARP